MIPGSNGQFKSTDSGCSDLDSEYTRFLQDCGSLAVDSGPFAVDSNRCATVPWIYENYLLIHFMLLFLCVCARVNESIVHVVHVVHVVESIVHVVESIVHVVAG